MSHQAFIIGILVVAALESCGPKQKKKEIPFQPTPTEVVDINEPVFKLTTTQEEQLKNIGKSNAVDRCNFLERLDSPMAPQDFAAEYTNEKKDKLAIQLQIKPLTKLNCLTNGSTLEFLLRTGAQTEGTPDLRAKLGTSFDFVSGEVTGAPTVSFITSCSTDVSDELIAIRQKAGESLDPVQKRKILKAAVEEICPQIKQQAVNYVIDHLSR